jgi:hypothetical protein
MGSRGSKGSAGGRRTTKRKTRKMRKQIKFQKKENKAKIKQNIFNHMLIKDDNYIIEVTGTHFIPIC